MNLLDLVERTVTLRRVGNNKKYNSVEYAGPCPWCGGADHFHVWPDTGETGRYQCMRGHCGRSGDAIQYLRDYDRMGYYQACRYLGAVPGERSPSLSEPRMPSLDLEPPGIEWQKRAVQFCVEARDLLWSQRGASMLGYLHQRGLKDDTIKRAALGYHPMTAYVKPATWGLQGEDKIKIPAGLVIPGSEPGIFWQVNIRTSGNPKYWAIAGSQRPLYQVHLLTTDKPAMMVESELDALLLLQEAGGLVAPVATCGTQGARHPHWQLQLTRPRHVLLAQDGDDEGDKAADWWLAQLSNARRWRPVAKDPTDIHRLGLGLREWVEDALELLKPPKPKMHVITGNLAVVRKLAVDPDTQPRLTVVTSAHVPTISAAATRQQPAPATNDSLAALPASSRLMYRASRADYPPLAAEQAIIPRGPKAWSRYITEHETDEPSLLRLEQVFINQYGDCLKRDSAS